MNTQTVPALDYIKNFDQVTVNGIKELHLSYGPDESITYSLRLRMPDFAHLEYAAAKTVGAMARLNLGSVTAIDSSLIDDNPDNIGDSILRNLNKEKSADVTLYFGPNAVNLILRPHMRAELAHLLQSNWPVKDVDIDWQLDGSACLVITYGDESFSLPVKMKMPESAHILDYTKYREQDSPFRKEKGFKAWLRRLLT